jgi:5'-methylthioadenosine phosphorylase
MIGVFGGSGFYSLLRDAEIVDMDTAFGKPSSPVTVGTIGRKEVAFIARHGLNHEYPPHKIPYKANIIAFKELGVDRIIAPTAVGSLKQSIEPGHFLVPDQFVNFTRRDDTFYEERPVTHISSAEPYCPELRNIIIESLNRNGMIVHDKGIAVIIEGPRFASRAESDFFRSNSWDIINMTQYPEMVLARELEICYANISIITDYDAGIKGDPTVKAVLLDDVVRVFQENNEKLKSLLYDIIPSIPDHRTCICSHALEGSRFEQ